MASERQPGHDGEQAAGGGSVRGVGGSGITRRGAIGSGLAFGLGAGLDHVLTKGAHGTTAAKPASPVASPYAAERVAGASALSASAEQPAPFYGPHQAGIATPPQEAMSFAAFDVVSDAIDDLRTMLESWTDAAASLTVGRPYQPAPEQLDRAPLDPGEATDLPPAQLTVTVGFGPSLFAPHGGLGLSVARPPLLQALPAFPGDRSDPSRSGGDVCVQACANDPQVAFHVVHLFAKLAGGVARLRWSQQGFARTASTSVVQVTTRNLMGFKDGTDNIRMEETGELERFVWVQAGDGPAWMSGGTYLVARRIRMLLEGWDALTLEQQQRVIGRDKLTGAPLGRAREYDRIDLQATLPNGELAIPTDAHIRVTSPETNQGQRILRRGYSYAEPIEPDSGELDAGLFFIAFQRNPELQFIPLQSRVSSIDALRKHTQVTSSSIFACPPGTREGGFIGDALLAEAS